ncbi:MAG: DUF7472 family protein [Halobacteriota archaeon]
MNLEEGMLRKIGVSVVAVVFFIALILYIGMSFDSGTLGSAGGLAIVGSMALFIVVMGIVGLWLAR